MPLLQYSDNVDEEIVDNLENDKILKKALLIRHNRHCEIIKQTKKSCMTSLFCQYCEIYDKINTNSKEDILKCKVKSSTNGVFEKKLRDTNNIAQTRSRNKQKEIGETFNKPIQKAKPSKTNLTKSLLKRFINLRAYSSRNKNRKKICRNRTSSKKITVDFNNKRTYLKKRRKKRKSRSQKRSRTSISLSWSRDSSLWFSSSDNSVKKKRYSRSFYISRQSTNRIRKKDRNSTQNVDVHSKVVTFLKSLRIRNGHDIFSGDDSEKFFEHTNETGIKHHIHIMTCSGDCNPTVTNIAKEKLKKTEETKEKDQKEKIEVNTIVEQKKLRQRIGKIYRKCSCCWNTTKVRFSPSIKVVNYFKTDDVPLKFPQNNHKRRKKCDSCEDVTQTTTKICRHQKDNEATRKYRLSSFLSEQEWMKRQTPVNLHIADALPLERGMDAELESQKSRGKKLKIVRIFPKNV